MKNMKLIMENFDKFTNEEEAVPDTALSEDMQGMVDSLKDGAQAIADKLGVGIEQVIDMLKATPGAAADAAGDVYDTMAELPGMGPGAEPARKMLRREDEEVD